MKTRPLPVIIVAFIFIIAGSAGIIYHANEYFDQSSITYESVLGILVRVLAIVCGLLLLKRVSWARWLAIAWLVYHVILSLFHSASEVITHLIFLAIVSFLLFMPKSSAYFRSAERQKDKKQND